MTERQNAQLLTPPMVHAAVGLGH